MNLVLSPVYLAVVGPSNTLEACTRSSLRADKQRENTDSPTRVNGIPKSKALMAVHFPVPFCPALSIIFSTKGVPSVSLKAKISVEISIRKESNSPLFHSLKMSLIS
eukprot:Awhi_evm2s3631